MNELTLLRELRSDQDGPSPDALTAGRAAMFERIGREVDPATTVQPARRHRARVVRGLSALAAGGLIAGLVFSDVVGLAGWRGGADAAAAAVLEQAAKAAVTFDDLIVGPGEYLLVETEGVRVADGQGADGGAIVSYRYRERGQLYVPADRDDEWVWVRPHSDLVEVLTPGGEQLIEDYFASIRKERGDEPELLRAPGGAFYGSASDSQWGDFDTMPRDPYRLLNHIYRVTLGAGPSPDGEALVFIADTLRQGTAPADLRAALLRAAAMIPGVTVTDGQAALDGQLGVAIGRLEPVNGLRQEIIIDRESGRLIGEREISISGHPEIPLNAGDVFRWSTVSTSVVPTAPAGGTPNGGLDVMGCVPGDQAGGWQCPAPGGN